MSGHSKWATTKHRKFAQDAKRSALFSKFSRIITVAARTGGDPNPENNFALIGKLWEAYTGTRYSAKDVAVMLALLKVARINTCISCGAEIPEGRQVCPTCLKEASR